MPNSLKFRVAKVETEPVRKEHNLIELMRNAVDGSGSFMSRRARQILWDEFRIAVLTSLAFIAAKVCFMKAMMKTCKAVFA